MYNNTTNHGIGQIPKYSFIVYCRCEIAIYHEYYLLIVLYKVDDVVKRLLPKRSFKKNPQFNRCWVSKLLASFFYYKMSSRANSSWKPQKKRGIILVHRLWLPLDIYYRLWPAVKYVRSFWNFHSVQQNEMSLLTSHISRKLLSMIIHLQNQ